jgi:intracellular sulfur oxidation DsrE/DsrF family protein
MQNLSRIIKQVFFIGILYFFSLAAVAEEKPNDADALKGLESVKVVYDITQGDPKRLLGRLNLIEQTAKMINDQGVKPEFVLAFRGPASFYASTYRDRIAPKNHKLADDIKAKIGLMSKLDGVKFEQCSVATGFLKIDNSTIYPDIKVVGNSWISLAGYQNRGYAYVPID